jgi:dTDP-D-glucose 4,6-dehydratase
MLFNNKKYTFVPGNLCNSKFVKGVLDTHQITHVIHFAAQSHVQNSFEDSLQFTYDNVLGTHTLLECCRKYGKIQKFIHVSTDEVYGTLGAAKEAVIAISKNYDEFLPTAYGAAFPYESVTFEQQLEKDGFAPWGWGVEEFEDGSHRICLGVIVLNLE